MLRSYIQLGRRASRPLLFVGALLATACQSGPPAPPSAAELHSHAPVVQASAVGGDVERQVARLRALTARFHDFDAAVAAGWSTKITECFSNAGVGGMGFHYGNAAYIDGVVDALQPELLLYEPQKNGKLRFVAVEYIVPFTAWTAQQPPQLYGQSFARNEPFGIWALHVWHERQNPRGLFADWNPKVNCDNAP
jgi:hypothetical protein